MPLWERELLLEYIKQKYADPEDRPPKGNAFDELPPELED